MNKTGVLDFAVKINILSGEFEFDCLRCIILLRPLHTAREVARVTFAGAHFFFFSPSERITYRHRWQISSIYVLTVPNILNIDIYYIEASVTCDRAVTDDRKAPIKRA